MKASTINIPVQLRPVSALQRRVYVSKCGRGQFSLLENARDAAEEGDVIHVMDGTYAENNLWKSGVTWMFHGGATVDYDASTKIPGTVDTYGIFDDRSAPGTACYVIGYGTFKYKGLSGDGECRGLFVTTDLQTTGAFRARYVQCSHMPGTEEGAAIWARTCKRIDLDIREMYAPAGSTATSLFWGDGDMFGRVDTIINEGGGYAFWAGNDAPQGWTGHIHGQNWLCTGPVSSAVYIAGTHADYRCWLTVDRIESTTSGAGAIIQGAGRIYLTHQKLAGYTDGLLIRPFGIYNGIQVWLNIMKLTGGGAAGNILNVDGAFTGRIIGRIDHFEDLAAASSLMRFDGTTCEIDLAGLRAKSVNGKGLNLIGTGKYRIKNYRIDTTNTNGAGNHAVSLGDATTGLVLENCILLAPALANGVNLAVNRTITNYGSVCNKNPVSGGGGVLTTNVQAIFGDANVV